MKKIAIILSVLSMLLSVACAQKAKKVDVSKDTVKKEVVKPNLPETLAYTCIVKDDQRRVIVDNKKLDETYHRCEIHYTKFGEKKQMAWAQATPTLCTEVFSRIRKNIEEKGFKCFSDAELNKEKKASKKVAIKKTKTTRTAKMEIKKINKKTAVK